MPGDSAVGLIEQLPERFRAARPQDAGHYRVRVGRATRDLHVTPGGCRVTMVGGTPDAEICTDHVTWRAIDAGRMSGIEAFAQRRLSVRGSIERALHFEPLFRRPKGGGLVYSLELVAIRGAVVSALVCGDPDAEPLVLLHGLGATKASWLTVVPQLARHHRVLAIDLPGFGASSKPWGRHDAPWFAQRVFDFIEVMGYEAAWVAGNSMGGKVATEMALLDPARVRGIACLCPATAFSDRPALWLARALRPELGVFLGRLPRKRLRQQLRALFANPDDIEDVWYESAIDDFLATWRSPGARSAFFTSARKIYLEEPYGRRGFWPRLKALSVPALYVYGERDILISHHFGPKITRYLPKAQVHVWAECGHVPQIEHPERTAKTMLDFFSTEARRDEAVAT